MRSPLSQMLHDILEDDHIQWHPRLMRHYTNLDFLLIWTSLPNLTFYLILWGFHRTFATGAACQQRTLTHPYTWSCLTLGLASVLMLRPISPELVLFPDFPILSILWYFCFASRLKLWYHAKDLVTSTCKMNSLSLLVWKLWPTSSFSKVGQTSRSQDQKLRYHVKDLVIRNTHEYETW